MSEQKRKPWMKWYPGDFNGDEALRQCSYAARGLWANLLGLMHKAQPYGHLVVNGQVPTLHSLAQMLGGTARQVGKLIDELKHFGVCSLREDGVMYSRRMVRDNQREEENRVNGLMGGNPHLKAPDNAGVNPPVKAQMPEARSHKPDDGPTNLVNGHALPEVCRGFTPEDLDVTLREIVDAMGLSMANWPAICGAVWGWLEAGCHPEDDVRDAIRDAKRRGSKPKGNPLPYWQKVVIGARDDRLRKAAS